MHKLPTKSLILVVFLTILAAACLMTLDNILPAKAQTTTEPWSEPVNLSHSGAAMTPYLVVDNQGIVHVFWEDEYAGTTYTSRLDGVWQPPSTGEFPFSTFTPFLVVTPRGWVHAFWIGEEQELFASRVPASDVGNAFSWEPARQLANTAITLDATVDARGAIHLTYLRPVSEDGFPAGIYYRRTTDNGDSWYLPVMLYDSAYFRSLTPEDANLHITSAGSNNESLLFISWDNRPRKQVFVTRSLDSGDNWEPIQEIAGPEPTLGSYIPFNIQVSTQPEQALLIYQVGEPGGSCTQYYRVSLYQGQSWSESQEMLTDTAACPEHNQFFNLADGTTLLMTSILERPYLIAWNGSRWSDPQAQSKLVGFEDPEIYSQVIMGCHQAALGPGDELVVAGCDLGDGGDIWATNRSLGDAAAWFPPPPVWSEPVSFAESTTPITDLNVLVDENDYVHALWVQAEDLDTPESLLAIYYTRWDGERWTSPQAVISSDVGDTLHPSFALDSSGRLFAAWSDSASSELLFSWAEADRANSPLEWAPTTAIPASQPGADYPYLLVDINGIIWVTYSLPLNEERGIYLTSSTDGGRTWTDPQQAFDAIAEGWSMAGAPQLAQTTDGTLHLLWEQLANPTNPEIIALYLTRSADEGESWTEPDLVIEGTLDWNALLSSGEDNVHILWQERRDGRPVLLHRVSPDNGLTWARPEGLASFAEQTSNPVAVSDTAGRLHLLQTEADFSANLTLSHRIWDGVRWGTAEGLDLASQSDQVIEQLAGDISSDGTLAAVFSSDEMPSVGGSPITQLFFSTRTVAIPNSEVETNVQVESTPAATPTVSPTSTPGPTPVPELPQEPGVGFSLGPLSLADSWTGVILGGGIAVFLVVLGFGVLLLKRRSH